MQHISEPLKKVLISILNARAKRVFGEDTYVVEYYLDRNEEFIGVIVKGHFVKVPIDILFGGEDEKRYC